MHANMWNLKGSKERLQIVERTEAHKRHLINIICAKSKINTHNSLSFRQSPSSPMSLYRRRVIQQDNRNLASKIASLSKPSFYQRQGSSLAVSRNLKVYSSLNRSIRRKEIEQENSKLFSRLIMTSPTIKRDSLVKCHLQTIKYKENLHRGKYRQPDYSQQACRLITRQPKFKCLNISYSQRKGGLIKKARIL